MWFDQAILYQIYPLGLCGAPAENDGRAARRILRLLDWVEHIKRLGATCVLFNPLFESDAHGYDTRRMRCSPACAWSPSFCSGAPQSPSG